MSSDVPISIDAFVSERNRALADLDVEWARQHLTFQPSDDAVLLIALHKARVHCTALPDELRIQSQQWLKDNNYADLFGNAIKVGELPR